MRTRVLILGSTGSIGTQALDVIARYPDRFVVVGLGAGGGNLDLLAGQAAAAGLPDRAVAIANPESGPEALLPGALRGPDAAVRLIESVPADVVLNAMTGSVGLGPTLAALGTGARLALANKESLVAGGSLVLDAAAPGQLIPVDSEHSAIAQCLRAGRPSEVARLVVTASGGPFRGKTREQLIDVTPEQAGKHPTWDMGPMITLNSATLVNKALEVVEAKLLFDVSYDQIEVVVHPQSIVHSMVTFVDGSTIVKSSPPSMTLPIALALADGDRLPGVEAPIDFEGYTGAWTFEPVDHQTFPAIELARAAGRRGGALTAVFNAANEEAAAGFFAGSTGFLDIVDTIAAVIADADQWAADPRDVADVLEAEGWARRRARALVAAAR